jgi:hypothetical protein
MPHVLPENPHKLRKLAAWYRAYAERAAAPWVSEGRLRTADDLERHAAVLEAGADGAAVLRVAASCRVTGAAKAGKLLHSFATDRRGS